MANITAQHILDLARKQLGTKATDIKRNKYNKWYYGVDVSGTNYDWCEVFIQWLFDKLGASDMLYTKTANCGAQGQAFYQNGRLFKSGYKVGDIVFFHWDNEKSNWVSGVYSLDHVGIIEKVNSDGTYTTIEGNTGNSANGEVMRRTRYKSQISCVGRPLYNAQQKVQFRTYSIKMSKIYKGAPTNKPEQVLALQSLLRVKRYKGKDGKKLTLDGVFGDNTEYALINFEKENKLNTNGVCERAKWSKLLGEYKTQ